MVDPLLLISRSNQYSMTGVQTPWYVLSYLWVSAYKRTLAANWKKIVHVAAAAGSLSR